MEFLVCVGRVDTLNRSAVIGLLAKSHYGYGTYGIRHPLCQAADSVKTDPVAGEGAGVLGWPKAYRRNSNGRP